MHILQLTKKFPYPTKDGESVAIMTMAEAYKALGCTVDLLAMNTTKHYVNVQNQNEAFETFSFISTVDIDTSIKVFDLLFNVLTKESYNIKRFINSQFETKLIELLTNEKYDFIQLETLYLTPYIQTIRKHSKVPIVYRSHNIEHEIWEDMSKASSNPLKAMYYKMASKRLEQYEGRIINTYDLLLPISISDTQKYKHIDNNKPTLTTPVGLNWAHYPFNETSENTKQLGYIGSLDWLPNIEGLKWFFSKIWPHTKTTFPEFKFSLAGRNGNRVEAYIPTNIHYLGEVDNALDFIKNLDIVVVPLLSGSGIRVKILESMAMGKIVFSTKKGFEGIPILDKENAFFFENAEEFISQLKYCLQDKERMKTIRLNARNTIKKHFDNQNIARNVLSTIKNK